MRRNDEITVEEAERLAPVAPRDLPGAGTAGGRPACPRRWCGRSPGRVPVLGVCLGHQAIVEVFGGEVGQARALVHGKATERAPTTAAGSSPGCRRASPPAAITRSPRRRCRTCLEVSATSADGEVMAVRHRELRVDGVQFHPESVLTPDGPALARNFLERS